MTRGCRRVGLIRADERAEEFVIYLYDELVHLKSPKEAYDRPHRLGGPLVGPQSPSDLHSAF